MIDFKKERIEFTGYKFKFKPTERSEDWTVEDELMSLSLYIQMQLIGKKKHMKNVGFYEWQENIIETALITANKSFAAGTGDINSKTYDERPEYKSVNELSIGFQAYALDYMGHYIFTEQGEEQKVEDKKHARAVAEAKRQYSIEQEELRLQKEEEAKEEAEVSKVVIPLKNYGK